MLMFVHHSQDLKQSKCPSTEEHVKEKWCVYIHSETAVSYGEKRYSVICDNMDEPEDTRQGARLARKTPHDLTHPGMQGS